MELVLLLKAVLLGIVEGLTEFLPVSSTGHLIIAGELLDFTGPRAATFEVFIQLGAILGVMWLYRAKIRSVMRGLDEPPARQFAGNLIVAFLPAAFAGLLFHDFIKNPIRKIVVKTESFKHFSAQHKSICRKRRNKKS